MAFYIPKYQKEILKEDDYQSLSYGHKTVKRKVPLKDELKFYKTANEINPDILEALMSNITAEPYVRSPPSSHCCYNGGTCFVPTYGILMVLLVVD